MKVGFRTWKTAAGAGLAIWIAEWLHLNFAISAAIITILCIEKTKKKSIQVSFNRFLACCIGLFCSSIFFELFGYTPLVFSLYILFVLPLLVRLRIQSGFVTSIVIVLHLLSLKTVSMAIIWNELLIIMVGIGVAILMNSYMPNVEKELLRTKQKVEAKFKKILYELAVFLDQGDQGWRGEELLELATLLRQAKLLALKNDENNLLKDRQGYFYYFHMRETQFHILERMLPLVSYLSADIPQRHMFANFLFELSESVKSQNTASLFLSKLNEERERMKNLPLPATRTEFETRASVFHLMNEMEWYLTTKIKFYQKNRSELEQLN